MLSDFRAFIMRGNVLDLAVAVIIGAAFGGIVTSLTEDMIMPVIGALTGGVDFSAYFVRLGAIPADFKGDAGSYADLKTAGVAMLGYGAFATAIVRFLILALAIFWLIRIANHTLATNVGAPPPPTDETVALREILAELRARPLAERQ